MMTSARPGTSPSIPGAIFLNSQRLAHGISGEKTRMITGHTTADMTSRYTHFLLQDYGDVLGVTEDMLDIPEMKTD